MPIQNVLSTGHGPSFRISSTERTGMETDNFYDFILDFNDFINMRLTDAFLTVKL